MTSSTDHGTPAAEFDVTPDLVRALLADQYPELAPLSITLADTGWDNCMFRLGNDLAIRMPRRAIGAELIEQEQKWLPILAKNLPIPAPVPLRVGQPGQGYPWHWSILHWLPGGTADENRPSPDQAVRIAEFLKKLHQPAPSDAPPSEVRGTPLSGRLEHFTERWARVSRLDHVPEQLIESIWHAALDAPLSTENRWLHGDLHARNVLVKDGVFSGIIDWGDMTSGDVATDLACAWHLFEDPSARDALMKHYGATDIEIRRAKGWAIAISVVLIDSGLVDDPQHLQMGEAVLRRLEADA